VNGSVQSSELRAFRSSLSYRLPSEQFVTKRCIFTKHEVTDRLPLVSGQCSIRGYPNWGKTFRKPETRRRRFEVQEGQETGAVCNRTATHNDDRSYRVPDRCYHATHLGQGQSPHTGTTSVVSLTGFKFHKENKYLRLSLCFRSKL
jgi:hypothetical protein